MSFLKAIWKGNGKHKKLCDEWALATSQEGDLERIPLTDGSSFNVKYLGRSPVIPPHNQHTATKAINSILAMNKASRKKPLRVVLTVSLKGIEVVDTNAPQQKPVLDYSIFRISNCSANSAHRRIFAFLATNNSETTECHAFLCPKRSVAEDIAITAAKTFNAVYEMWQTTQQMTSQLPEKSFVSRRPSAQILPGLSSIPRSKEKSQPSQPRSNNVMLVDLSSSKSDYNNWVSFDNEQEEETSDLTRRSSQSPSESSPLYLPEKTKAFGNTSEWTDNSSINLFLS